MKPLHTAIAVTLAVIVVAIIFIAPGLSPFGPIGGQAPAAAGAATDTTAAANAIDTTSQTAPDMQITDNGQLQIQDQVVGTGPTLAPGDTVQIKYTGMLTNGTVFDSSDAHGGAPLTLIVAPDGSLQLPSGGGLIEGWSKGVVGMKEGGTRRLVIPPALGYGSQAVGPIPANSTLVFDLQLVKVTPSTAQ